MPKLKLHAIDDAKPVRLNIELPAALHKDLLAYSEILGREMGKTAIQPAKLVVAMLKYFVENDRAFAKARRETTPT